MRLITCLAISLLCGLALSQDRSSQAKDAVPNPNRVEVTEDDSGVIEKVFENGRLIKKTTAKGTAKAMTWLFTYSKTGQLLTEIDPKGSVTQWEYDNPDSTVPTGKVTPDGKYVDLRNHT